MKGCWPRILWRNGGWVILCAGVVLVGMRVNRTPRVLLVPPAVPAAFDEVIADVSVDIHTLKSALESIQGKSAARFVFDPKLQQMLNQQSADPHGHSEELLRFQKVRLGVLLAYVLDEWQDDLPVSCYMEGSAILFCRTGTKRANIHRLYDLRGVTDDWIRWKSRVNVWAPGPSAEQFRARIEGRFGAGAYRYFLDDEAKKKTSVEFINGMMNLRSGELRTSSDCGGWMVADAPPEIQREIGGTLKLWSDGRPGMQPAGEIRFYKHGELPGFTAQWNVSKNVGESVDPLNMVIPWVKCVQAPLEKFIDRLVKASGTRIFVDWHALQGASAVWPSTPVTLDLHNVKAGDALQLALDQCRHSAQRIKFVCADGIVKVSVESQLQPWMLRVYDARDLIEYALKQDPRTPGVVIFKLASSPRIWVPGFDDLTSAEENAGQALRNVLEDVAEETWPNSAEYHYFAGRCVISATAQDHQRIGETLAAMRAKLR